MIEPYQMIGVSEDLPPENKIVVGYSSVHRHYYFVKWTASRGWLDQDGDAVKLITHWSNQELYLPFPISEEVDLEEAEKYSFRPN